MVSLGSEGTRFALSLAEVTEGEAKAERGSPVTPGTAACNLLLTSAPTYRLDPMNGTDRGLDSVDQLAALHPCPGGVSGPRAGNGAVSVRGHSF